MKEVARALQRSPGDGLAALLTRWRENPAPALAERIEALGEHVETGLPELPYDDQARWMERFGARHPADLGPLVRHAFDGRSRRRRHRLELLLEWPRDPRTTGWLLEWCKGQPMAAWYDLGPLYTRAFRLLASHRDPRAEDRLLEWQKTLQDEVTGYWRETEDLLGRIDRLLPRVRATWEPESSSALAVLDAALAEILAEPVSPEQARPQSANDAALVREAIYEDPDDDGTIRVWADLLEERGDPLAELVRLQLAPRRTKKQTTRMEQLRKKHIGRLLGPLAPVVDPKTARFQRGLLHAAKVRFATPEHKAQLLEHPFWRSVRFVQTANFHLEHLPSVVGTGLRLLPDPHSWYGSPAGYRYRKVNPPPWGQLAWWGRQEPRPLAHITAALPRQVPSDRQLAALRDGPGLADLQTLHLVETMPYAERWGLDPETRFGRLLQLELVRTVPHLVLDDPRPSEVDLLALWNLFRDGPGRLTLFAEHGWTLDLRLDDQGFHLDATSVNTWLPRLEELKVFVPDASQYTSITVRTPPWPTRPHRRLAAIVAACEQTRLPRTKA